MSSASPAGPSPAGPPSTTPNGVAAAARRPKPKTNPLVSARKPARRSVLNRPAPGTPAGPSQNASTPGTRPPPPVNGARSLTTAPPALKEPEGIPQEFPLFTTKRALLEGVRHHIFKLQSKAKVDPGNQEQFMRPVFLHRRDPRLPPVGSGQTAMELDIKEDLADVAERERLDQQKAERRRIREENQAQIAPTGKTQRPPAFQKKTEQVFRADDTPEAVKASQLRYEEAIPWHLEDFSGKSVWQGTYEAALSECHMALVPQNEPAQFRLFPLEKYYRFKEKSKFKSYTLEEAEERMSKKFKEDRWSMNEKVQRAKQMELAMKEGGLARTEMSLRRGERNELMKTSEAQKRQAFKREGAGGGEEDDIDFNFEEEFADDEENPLLEGENDEVKDAAQKIRKEQLGANTFNLVDEKQVDEEAEREKQAEEARKAAEKATRKTLMKREHNFEYDDESEDNPYASKSDSDNSDSDEEKKKDEEGKDNDKLKEEKPSPGNSTRGTNTPSGRASKHAAPPMQKTASSSSLKRPGSPIVSDVSGNESSRKKQKKSHLPPGATAASRQLSPDAADRSRAPSIAGINKRLAGAGSGSDTEVSVSGRKIKKQKAVSRASPSGTPGGSRAVSPSRAASPGAPPVQKPAPPPTGPPPTPEEIRQVLPAEGIMIKDLLAIFKGREKTNGKEFIDMVKQNSHYDKANKLLFPKKPRKEPGAAQ
ncbi:hypothetical protein NA57DRAFT_77433 [Rhizodiscina lignyota]|uniref:Transcription initiation factor IIF subunit alpha n=1 Tax=Rhizodiscina lignyota TaxID=1504668 RepID=A0A9P4M8U8_9PEZI|nr:hypothetical protein NA57DRAFT_77433 [Rhizodiscina lignyota]